MRAVLAADRDTHDNDALGAIENTEMMKFVHLVTPENMLKEQEQRPRALFVFHENFDHSETKLAEEQPPRSHGIPVRWTQDQWFKTLEELNPDDPTSKTAKEYIDTALEALDAIADGSKYDELVHLSDSQSDLLGAPAVMEYITLNLRVCVAITNDFYREREIKKLFVGTQLSANHAAGWCAGKVSGHCKCECSAEKCRCEYGPDADATQLRIKWKGNWSKAQQYDILPYSSHFSKRNSAPEADEAYRKLHILSLSCLINSVFESYSVPYLNLSSSSTAHEASASNSGMHAHIP